jgi:hypothetical protein
MNLPIKLGAVIVFAAVMYLTFELSTPTALNWTGADSTLPPLVASSLLMFAGIVFGCLFRSVKEKSGNVSLSGEIRNVFNSPSFIAALCVSPFVFMGVYTTVSQVPGDPASYLLAFQNGFFCQSIFEKTTGTP